MIEWINRRFGVRLDDIQLTSIKNFSLVWNIFEGSLFEGHFTVDKAHHLIQATTLDLEEFQPQLDYFKERYTEDDHINNRFASLHFRGRDREELVREVLLGIELDSPKVILALLIIVYRLRNNLFHGIKDIRVIDQQHDNFMQANSFLMALLDHF